MTTVPNNLEELYSRLSLEEEDEGGVIIPEGEVEKRQDTCVLVWRFFTEKNINFNAMKNVLVSFGGIAIRLFFFIIFWICRRFWMGKHERLNKACWYITRWKKNEDPHLVDLHSSDIWVKLYDVPTGLVSENILVNIGNAVGKYVKSDPANVNGGRRMYV